MLYLLLKVRPEASTLTYPSLSLSASSAQQLRQRARLALAHHLVAHREVRRTRPLALLLTLFTLCKHVSVLRLLIWPRPTPPFLPLRQRRRLQARPVDHPEGCRRQARLPLVRRLAVHLEVCYICRLKPQHVLLDLEIWG